MKKISPLACTERRVIGRWEEKSSVVMTGAFSQNGSVARPSMTGASATGTETSVISRGSRFGAT
jgi:hypothetical protein